MLRGRKRKPLDTFVCVAAARNLSAWNVRRRLRLGIGRTSTRTRLFRALVRNRSSFGSVRNGIADGALRIGCGLSGLYTWRKELLTTAVAGFVPVQVEPEARGALLAGGAPVSTAAASAPPARSISGRIEIEFPHGVRVRVDGGVDEAVLRGVLAVLDGR